MPPETSKNRISKGKVGRSCSKHILNNIGPCLYTPEKILSIESLPKVFSSSINCAITLSQPDKSEKSVNHIFINNYEIDEMRFGGKIQNIQEPARNFNGGYNIRIFVEDFSGLIAATEFYNIGDNRYSVTRDKATYSLVFSDNQNQIPKSLKESYAHRFSIGDHVLIEGRTLTPTHWEDITENQDGDKTKPNTTSRENLFLYVNLTNIKKATKAELGQHAIDIIINYCLIRTPSNEKTKISELILTDLKSYKPENEQEQFENSEFEIEEEEKEERKEEEEEKEEIKEEEEEEEEEEDTKENVESDINKANYKGEKPFIGALHSAMADIFLDEFFKAVPRCEK
ncbi:uncharacterized protein SAPINGB_P001655 [Magnusiomyces paraingens]|uniref:Uncharacterized protein n=1 Tax=Magnusiomyces paraingens TaxID=2606893 RepID=A0A5E8B8Y9_9ASCO|nr:uncharacterized protein SAPINGB_P001655 [Saprochaete ingens]VVT47325.1 unnamed protein product [Saprochaete ingens]